MISSKRPSGEFKANSKEENTKKSIMENLSLNDVRNICSQPYFVDITDFSLKTQQKLTFGFDPPVIQLYLKVGSRVLRLYNNVTYALKLKSGLELFKLSAIGKTAAGIIPRQARCIGAIAAVNDLTSDRIAQLLNFSDTRGTTSFSIDDSLTSEFKEYIDSLDTANRVSSRQGQNIIRPPVTLTITKDVIQKPKSVEFSTRPGQLKLFFGPFPGLPNDQTSGYVHKITKISGDIIRFISSSKGSWCFLETKDSKIDLYNLSFIEPVFVPDVSSLRRSIQTLDSPCLELSPTVELAQRSYQRVFDSDAKTEKEIKAWQALDIFAAGKILLDMSTRFTPDFRRSLENLIILKPFDKIPYVKAMDGQTVISTEAATAPVCLHNSSSEIFLKGLARTALMILFGDKNTAYTGSLGAALSFQARSQDELKDRGYISVSQDFMSVTFLKGVPFVKPNLIINSIENSESKSISEKSIRIMASRCQESVIEVPLSLHDHITSTPRLVDQSIEDKTVHFPLVLAISDSMALRPHIIILNGPVELPVIDEMIGCLGFPEFKKILGCLASHLKPELSWLDVAHCWAHLCPSKPFILCPSESYLELLEPTRIEYLRPGTILEQRDAHTSVPILLTEEAFMDMCRNPSSPGVYYSMNRPYLEVRPDLQTSLYLRYIPPLNDVKMGDYISKDPNHLFPSDGSNPPWIQRLEHFKTVQVSTSDELILVLTTEHKRSRMLSIEGSGSRVPLTMSNTLTDYRSELVRRKTFQFNEQQLNEALEAGCFITDDVPEPEVFSLVTPLLIPASEVMIKTLQAADVKMYVWQSYYSSKFKFVPGEPNSSNSSLTAKNVKSWELLGKAPDVIFASNDSDLLPPFFKKVIYVLLFKNVVLLGKFKAGALYSNIHTRHFAPNFFHLSYNNPTIVLTTEPDHKGQHLYETLEVSDADDPNIQSFVAESFETSRPRGTYLLPREIEMTANLKRLFSGRFVPFALKDETPIFIDKTTFKLIPKSDPDRCTVWEGQRIRLINATAPPNTVPPIDCIIQRSGLARDFIESSAPVIVRRHFTKKGSQSIYISFSTEGESTSVDLESFMAVGSSTLSLSTTGGFEKWGYDKFASMYLRDVRQKASDYLGSPPTIYWFYHALSAYLRFCRFTFVKIPPDIFVEAIIESDSEKTPGARALSHLLLKLAAYFIKENISPKSFVLGPGGPPLSKERKKGGHGGPKDSGVRDDDVEHATGFFYSQVREFHRIKLIRTSPNQDIELPPADVDCIIVFSAPIDNALSFLKPWRTPGKQGISIRPNLLELERINSTSLKPLCIMAPPSKRERARIISGTRLDGTPFKMVAPNLHVDNITGDIFEAIAFRLVSISAIDDQDHDTKEEDASIEIGEVKKRAPKAKKSPQGARLRSLISEKLDTLVSDEMFVAEFEPIYNLVKQFSMIGEHLSPREQHRADSVSPLVDALDVIVQNNLRHESKPYVIPYMSQQHFDFISTKLSDSDRSLPFDMDAWAYQTLFHSVLKKTFKKSTPLRASARMDLQTYISRRGVRSRQLGLLMASLVRLGDRKDKGASTARTWQAIVGATGFITILRDTLMVSGIQSKRGTVMHPFAPNLFHEIGGDLSVMMQPTFQQSFSSCAQVARGGKKPGGIDFNLLQNLLKREAIMTPHAGNLVADGNVNPHTLVQPNIEQVAISGIFKRSETPDLRDIKQRSVSVETCFLDIFPTLRPDVPFIWGENAFSVDAKSLQGLIIRRVLEKVDNLDPLTRILLSYILTLDHKMMKLDSKYFSRVSGDLTPCLFSRESSASRQPPGFLLKSTFNPSSFVEVKRSTDRRCLIGSLTAEGCMLDSLFVAGLSVLLGNTSAGYTNAPKTAQYRTAGLPVWHRLFSMMPASSGAYYMYLDIVKKMFNQMQRTQGEGYKPGRDVMTRNLGAKQSKPETILEHNSDKAFADIANNSSSAGGKIHIDTGIIRKINFTDPDNHRIELKLITGTKAKAVVMTTLATVSEKYHSILFNLKRTKEPSVLAKWSKDLGILIEYADFESSRQWARRPGPPGDRPDPVCKIPRSVIEDIFLKIKTEAPPLQLLFQCVPFRKKISYSLFLVLSSVLDTSRDKRPCPFCGLLFGRAHDSAHIPYSFLHIQEEVRNALMPCNAPSCVPRVTAGSAKVRVAYIAGTSWMMFADHKGVIEQFLWLAPEVFPRPNSTFYESIDLLESTNSLAKYNTSSSLLLGPSIFEPSGINNVPGRGMTTKTAAIGVALRQMMWSSVNSMDRDLRLMNSDQSPTCGVISILSTVDFRSWDTSLGMVMAMMRWVTEELSPPEIRNPNVLALITYLDNLVSQFYSDRTVGGLTYSIVGLFPVGSLTFPVDFLPSGLPITAVVGSLHHVLICTFEKLFYVKLFSIKKDAINPITTTDVATVFAGMTKHIIRPHGEIVSLSQYGITNLHMEEIAYILNTVDVTYNPERAAVPNSGYCSDDSSSALSFTPNRFIDEETHQYWTFLISRLTFIAKFVYQFFGSKVNPDDNMASTRGIVYLKMTFAGALFGRLPTSVDHENENFSDQTLSLDEKMNVSLSLGGSNLFSTRTAMLPTKFSFAGKTRYVDMKSPDILTVGDNPITMSARAMAATILLLRLSKLAEGECDSITYTEMIEEKVVQTSAIEEKSEYKASKLEGVGEIFDVAEKVASLAPKLRDNVRAEPIDPRFSTNFLLDFDRRSDNIRGLDRFSKATNQMPLTLPLPFALARHSPTYLDTATKRLHSAMTSRMSNSQQGALLAAYLKRTQPLQRTVAKDSKQPHPKITFGRFILGTREYEAPRLNILSPALLQDPNIGGRIFAHKAPSTSTTHFCVVQRSISGHLWVFLSYGIHKYKWLVGPSLLPNSHFMSASLSGKFTGGLTSNTIAAPRGGCPMSISDFSSFVGDYGTELSPALLGMSTTTFDRMVIKAERYKKMEKLMKTCVTMKELMTSTAAPCGPGMNLFPNHAKIDDPKDIGMLESSMMSMLVYGDISNSIRIIGDGSSRPNPFSITFLKIEPLIFTTLSGSLIS